MEVSGLCPHSSPVNASVRAPVLPRLLTFVLTFAAIAVHAASDAPMADMLRATCRITRDGRSGTGFFVRRDSNLFLVTAAHVFEESNVPEARLVLREKKDDGTIARRELPVTVRRDDKPLWKRHASEDIAAMPVALPASIDVAALPFARILRAEKSGASRVHLGDDVWLPGYPAQLEANAAGWPVLRRGMIATHPLSPVASVPTLLVDIRSFGGDSGGPLFAMVGGVPQLAGVVVGMQRQTDHTTSAFEEKTLHTPLGLAITVQSELVVTVIEQFAK